MTNETEIQPTSTEQETPRPYVKPAVERIPLSQARLGTGAPSKSDGDNFSS